MAPIIECQGLTKKYSNTYALYDLSFSLPRGQIVGLLGPNGSGKTTFIKLLNGLLTPTSGQVLINGTTPSPETKKVVSYLPDRTYLNEKMTITQALDLFANFYEDFDMAQAEQMIKNLHLDPSKKIRTLSKGNREKVQLILVMSRRADLYVLDEPIGGVDPASRDYIIHTIINNYNTNATVLISTHLISEIESVLDHVIMIQNGRLVLDSSVDAIRTEKGQSVDELFREVFRC